MTEKASKKSRAVKVPVVIQMEALECGAACLAMVLAYYKKWVPLEIVRKDCGISRDGSNAMNILKAAKQYGMTAKGYRYKACDLVEDSGFPCIIHWNFNHFVVLCGFKKDRAVINDPAKGNYSVSMTEFEKSFTGICLKLRPNDDFVMSGKPKSIFRYAAKKLSGSGFAFALIAVTTAITSLIGITIPGFSNFFADRLLGNADSELLYPFILCLAFILVMQAVSETVKFIYTKRADTKIQIVANAEYIWHILRMPMEFFSQRMAGDLADRKSKNAEITGRLLGIFAPLIIQCAMLIFYLAVMLRYSVLLTLIGVVSVVINIMLSAYVSKKRVDITRVASRDKGNLVGNTISGIEMIETIKANGTEDGFFSKWAGFQAATVKGETMLRKFSIYTSLIPGIVRTVANTLVFMGSVYLCMRGEWTVGTITAFSGFLASFLSPAGEIARASGEYQEMRTDMERIEDIMEYPTAVNFGNGDISEDVEYDKLSGNIELRNVTFGYSRLDEPLISDFSLSIKQGQRIALVGGSGSGKSTVAKLISGLYKPWSGEILFDGKPIEEIDRSVFTGSVSVVDQDIILFEDTIANNIKMWDTSIEDFEMILAARDAQIHNSIIQREGGYNYVLSGGGRDLSGGEMQRLEIARVLATDPTVVIMDEATSALDAKTEYNVVKSICDRGVTNIVIAHRLSTIRDCDEIIVFDHGKVVERGTHDELYNKGGLYSRLVTSE